MTEPFDDALVEDVARNIAAEQGKDYDMAASWALLTDEDVATRGYHLEVRVDARRHIDDWHRDARAALAVAVPRVVAAERERAALGDRRER